MNGCYVTYTKEDTCRRTNSCRLHAHQLPFLQLLRRTILLLRHQIEPRPFYTTVGHLNIGSVGRLIPTMSRKICRVRVLSNLVKLAELNVKQHNEYLKEKTHAHNNFLYFVVHHSSKIFIYTIIGTSHPLSSSSFGKSSK